MAVGDGENDMEMLQLAGVSVAMDNATPSIKLGPMLPVALMPPPSAPRGRPATGAQRCTCHACATALVEWEKARAKPYQLHCRTGVDYASLSRRSRALRTFCTVVSHAQRPYYTYPSVSSSVHGRMYSYPRQHPTAALPVVGRRACRLSASARRSPTRCRSATSMSRRAVPLIPMMRGASPGHGGIKTCHAFDVVGRAAEGRLALATPAQQ
eukprot:scaffold911_cov361-Prasinococcus_capsulatus_cf.AAC.6